MSGASVGAAAGSAPQPAWSHEDQGLPRLARRLTRALQHAFGRWLVCRGNKVAYLRRLGARIGSQVTLVNRVEEFGTEPWLIELGSRVSIASGVMFITHDGASRVIRHRIEGASAFGNGFGPIRILDNCVIGARAILMPGVTVGPNSIVGAGSVVTRDVPAGVVAAGMPARALCTLQEYAQKYQARMIRGLSSDRRELRRQLTRHFWGEER